MTTWGIVIVVAFGVYVGALGYGIWIDLKRDGFKACIAMTAFTLILPVLIGFVLGLVFCGVI